MAVETLDEQQERLAVVDAPCDRYGIRRQRREPQANKQW